MLSSKLLQLKIESYLSFNELAFKTRSFKDSKLKINWWQLSWRNSLIRFYTVFTSRNTKTAACIKNEHYAIGRKIKTKHAWCSVKSFQTRCAFFICLRLFWTLDEKFISFYRIRWVIIWIFLQNFQAA